MDINQRVIILVWVTLQSGCPALLLLTTKLTYFQFANYCKIYATFPLVMQLHDCQLVASVSPVNCFKLCISNWVSLMKCITVSDDFCKTKPLNYMNGYITKLKKGHKNVECFKDGYISICLSKGEKRAIPACSSV